MAMMVGRTASLGGKATRSRCSFRTVCWTVFALVLAVGMTASASSLPDIRSLYPAYQEVYPDTTTTEGFGGFTALSRDGTTGVVGASGAEPSRNLKGRGVYVYQTEGSSWQLVQHLFINDSNAQFGSPGYGTATNGDGSVITYTALPSPATDGGVYIFTQTGASQWSFIGQPVIPTPFCGFDKAQLKGIAMSYSGSIIATTGHQGSDCGILIIERQGSSAIFDVTFVVTWSASIDTGHINYEALAMTWDGGLVSGVTSLGNFLLFERNSTGGYNLKTYLYSSAFLNSESISMGRDGGEIVVGTYQGEGASYLQYNGTDLVFVQLIPRPSGPGYSAYFGAQVKLFHNGQRLLISDPHFGPNFGDQSLGAVFLFQLHDNTWTQHPGNLTLLEGVGSLSFTGFGYAVDVSYTGGVILVGAYGARDGIGSAVFFQANQECSPAFGMKVKQCASLIRKCSQKGISMKWAGKGCRRNGKALGDGGCQCDNYCGYQCPSACKADRQCAWSPNQGCLVKSTGLPGLPITVCT